MNSDDKKCLYLIDVQNGFISNNTKHILTRIDKLLKSNYFDYIIASKFINYENSPYVKYLNWNKFMDDNDIMLYKPIEEKANLIVEKNKYTSLTNDVLNYLSDNNLKEIYLAGIDTDCCVLATAISFFENDIKPYVLEYYSASNGGNDGHKSALTVLKRLIGEISIVKGSLI